MINELRGLISEFQNQTRSNDVLMFVIWLENRKKFIEKLAKANPKAIADDIVKGLNKEETK